MNFHFPSQLYRLGKILLCTSCRQNDHLDRQTLDLTSEYQNTRGTLHFLSTFPRSCCALSKLLPSPSSHFQSPASKPFKNSQTHPDKLLQHLLINLFNSQFFSFNWRETISLFKAAPATLLFITYLIE